VEVDDVITYNFSVKNTGAVTLTNINITDLVAGVTVLGGPIASLAPGAEDTTTFTATYTITQADIDAGTFSNTAEVVGTPPSGPDVTDISDDDSYTEDDPTIITICNPASIAIVKTGILNDENQNGCTDVDETISYTFTVTNEGNVGLSNVSVTDPLIATITGPIGDINSDGILNVTETWMYAGTYAITQIDLDAGEVINQATATGTAPDATIVSDLSDDDSVLEDDPTVTVVCQNPAIALIKTGVLNDTNGDGCANVDETIDYSFKVFNLGNVTLTNVTITDPLVSVVGGPITMAPNTTDETTFTATHIITQVDIDAGSVENQATVTGDDPAGNTVSDLSDDDSEFEDDPTVTVLCQDPAIALIKIGVQNDENDNGCADLGETISYSFSVKNTGNVELTNVIITDPMVDVVGGPITLTSGEEDTTTFTAIYTITQTDIDTGSIQNQATIEGTGPNGNQVFDQSDDNNYLEDDPTVTLVCNNLSIGLEKTGVFNDENGNNSSDVGESISYEFTVTNTGTVSIYNITITDPLPGIAITGGPITQLLPGEVDSTTFTATYYITQEDIDNLKVVNQATVTGEDINGVIVQDDSDDPTDLTNNDNNGDGDPDDPTVVLLPILEPASFEIFNGITPNGDGYNDFFLIQGINDYPKNNVKIFNRWGVLVYETDGYGGSTDSENVFKGISEGRVTIEVNKELPTGTYFYILTFPEDNLGKASYNGYLYINR
ncbi:gliding motility-associated C-terminal domain-containing protein, partial [Aequorivita viscosa]|nr:gliding motility-associated C-terminal domain-containing protein [Aequorivita viscosa]